MSPDSYLAVKLNVHILPESTGVVIFQCFGITKSLWETPPLSVQSQSLLHRVGERQQTSRTGLDMSILSLTVFSKAVLGQLTA